jgi:hypothetical protein
MRWRRQGSGHVKLCDKNTVRDKRKYSKEFDSFRKCAEINFDNSSECNVVPRETYSLPSRIVDAMINKLLSSYFVLIFIPSIFCL